MTDAKREKALLAEFKSNERSLVLLREKHEKLSVELGSTTLRLKQCESTRLVVAGKLRELGFLVDF
jgi:hypothetical protein